MALTHKPIDVCVCGGSDYSDLEYFEIMDDYNETYGPFQILMVLVAYTWDPRDALLAWTWAKRDGGTVISIAVVHVDWNKAKTWAGPIYDRHITDEVRPDLVIAFSGCRGAERVIREAEKANIPVILVPPKVKKCP